MLPAQVVQPTPFPMPMGEYEYYSRQKPKPDQNGVRTVTFRKVGGSVGIRGIGGNEVGIFVSAVAADSPAALHGVCCGDRIVEVNGRPMRGVTRESAVQLLLALDDHVSLRLEHARQDFEHVRNSQLGDNFYIRSHFTKEKKSSPLELSVSDGDIFHVTDTLFGGTVGLWQAARVYSANANKGEPPKGVIPNQSTAESIAREQRRLGEAKGRSGGTLLRRKLESRRTKSLPKNVLADPAELSSSVPPPAYERVALNTPSFHRPVVLFGPLADVARSHLLSQFPNRFAEPSPSDYCGGGGASGGQGGGVIRLAALDSVIASGKHCVLDISLESVLLFPLSSKGINYDSDMESSKGEYADYASRRDDSTTRAPNPMSRSIYDWDNSQSMASSIDSPHSTSELSRTAPLGWVTLPRRGAEHAADAPAKPHRGMSIPDTRPTNTEKRGSLSANNGGLPTRTSSNASREEKPVSPAKEKPAQLTNGHEPPIARQPSSPGYYHVKQEIQLLNDDSLYHDARLANEIANVRLREEARLRDDRLRGEQKLQERPQIPLQPPNPDMYSPREEKPQTQMQSFGSHQPLTEGGTPNRFPRGSSQPVSRPTIAPKPQYTDGVVRNRWQDSVTPEPMSRIDSPKPPIARQPSSPGYYHVKQLLNDDSLYHDARLANEIANVRLREEARLRDDRLRGEQRLQERPQIPLQPPNPDMYSPREEKPQTQMQSFGSHQPLTEGGAPNRFPRGSSQPVSRPTIAPKPQYTDGVVRNRWQDSVTPEPMSRIDSPSMASNSLSLVPPPRTSRDQSRPGASNGLTNGSSSSNSNTNGQASLPERNDNRSPRKEDAAAP
ncbi:PDZ/DHR/GLGF domain protein, partial [Oesophagostomum dentatum]